MSSTVVAQPFRAAIAGLKPCATSVSLVLIAGLSIACQKTAGEAAAPGGGGGRGGRGGRGGGGTIAVQTTNVQRMSIQRQVDLAGTLLSPDMAKIRNERAGRRRQVPGDTGARG